MPTAVKAVSREYEARDAVGFFFTAARAHVSGGSPARGQSPQARARVLPPVLRGPERRRVSTGTDNYQLAREKQRQFESPQLRGADNRCPRARRGRTSW